MKLDTTRVHNQLNRLLASPQFARSKRMARFLQFVVERSLQDDVDRLRERQIGIEVFDRSPDWDPKLDNIVRSEARRLREKLDAYAADGSPDETIRITIPKGSYVASFTELTPRVQPNMHFVQLQRRARWKLYSLLVAFALLILAVTINWVWVSARNTMRAGTDEFEIVPFSSEIGQQFSPSISPDGTRIAYVWDGDKASYDIYIKTLKNGSVERLTDDHAPNTHPSWSPDGAWIAFLRFRNTRLDLVVKNLSSRNERTISAVHDVSAAWTSENPYAGCQSPAWSADAKQIVLADSSDKRQGYGLVRVDVGNGQRVALTTPPGEDQDCFPRYSRDGKRIAFVRYISHGVGDLFTILSDGSGLKQLTYDRRGVRGLDWTPDGSHLVFTSNRRGASEIRTIHEEGGASEPVHADTASASEISVASDGRWMVYVESQENWNLWRVALTKGHLGKPERFLASTGQNHSPSYSPDGKIISFVSDRSGTPEIWFADNDGSNLRQMTHFGGPWLGSIRWAPDGQKILFDARPNGHSAIFSMPRSGGPPHTVEQGQYEARRPSWSRDGKSLYYDSTRDGPSQIYRRSLDTGLSLPIGPTNAVAAMESHDGKMLLFGNGGANDLWSYAFNGEVAARLPNVNPDPSLDWAVGVGGVYYATHETEGTRILYYDFKRHASSQVGHLDQVLSQSTPSLTLSPDQHWLLYATTDHLKSDIKIRRALLPAQGKAY